MVREFRETLSAELTAIFREAAPYDYDERDDTHLQEELDVRLATAGQVRLTVHSPVRDPRSGFAYTDVTRFGHRGVLRPRKAKLLRWKDASGWHAAKETAGHHPASDWVQDARPEADRAVAEAADRLGRSISTRLLS